MSFLSFFSRIKYRKLESSDLKKFKHLQSELKLISKDFSWVHHYNSKNFSLKNLFSKISKFFSHSEINSNDQKNVISKFCSNEHLREVLSSCKMPLKQAISKNELDFKLKQASEIIALEIFNKMSLENINFLKQDFLKLMDKSLGQYVYINKQLKIINYDIKDSEIVSNFENYLSSLNELAGAIVETKSHHTLQDYVQASAEYIQSNMLVKELPNNEVLIQLESASNQLW